MSSIYTEYTVLDGIVMVGRIVVGSIVVGSIVVVDTIVYGAVHDINSVTVHKPEQALSISEECDEILNEEPRFSPKDTAHWVCY